MHQGPEKWGGGGGGGGLEIGVYDRGLFCALTERRLCPAWLWNAAVLTDRRPLCGPSCHRRVSSRRATGPGASDGTPPTCVTVTRVSAAAAAATRCTLTLTFAREQRLRFRFEAVDNVSAQARTRDAGEKKKKRKEEIAAFARQLEGSGPRTARACLCASPSWRMSRDADGERRRGPACSAAPRAPRVKSRRGSLTHTLRTRRLFLTFAQ